MLALLFLLSQIGFDPAKWTSKVENGPTALGVRAGWRSIFDGLAADAWKSSKGAASAQNGWLLATPGPEAELTYVAALGDFELQACVYDATGFSLPLMARVSGGRVFVEYDGKVLGQESVAVGARRKLGPVVVTRADGSDVPWQLGLAVSAEHVAFSGIALRELAALPGSRIDLMEGGLDPTIAHPEDVPGPRKNPPLELVPGKLELKKEPKNRLEFAIEGRDLRVDANAPARLYLGPRVADFMLEFEVEGNDARAWSLCLGDLAIESGRQVGRHFSFGLLYSWARLEMEGWNRVRIECVGPSMRAWVNDRPAFESLDEDMSGGRIALDCFRAGRVVLRGMTLRHLGQSSWLPLAMESGSGGEPAEVAWKRSLETWQDFTLRAVLPADLDELLLVAHSPVTEPSKLTLAMLDRTATAGAGSGGNTFGTPRRGPEEPARPRVLELTMDGGSVSCSLDGHSLGGSMGSVACREGLGTPYPRGWILLVSKQREALSRVGVNILEGSTH